MRHLVRELEEERSRGRIVLADDVPAITNQRQQEYKKIAYVAKVACAMTP